jgi:hypothetical protein
MTMAALIAPVTPVVDIMSPVIIAAENDDIRHGRADDDRAAAIGADIADTTGDNYE